MLWLFLYFKFSSLQFLVGANSVLYEYCNTSMDPLRASTGQWGRWLQRCCRLKTSFKISVQNYLFKTILFSRSFSFSAMYQLHREQRYTQHTYKSKQFIELKLLKVMHGSGHRTYPEGESRVASWNWNGAEFWSEHH